MDSRGASDWIGVAVGAALQCDREYLIKAIQFCGINLKRD